MPPPPPDTLTHPPPVLPAPDMPPITTSPTTRSPVATRTRDEFDSDADQTSMVDSPRAKAARTSIDSDAPSSAASVSSSSSPSSPSPSADVTPEEVTAAPTPTTHCTDATTLALLEELECGMCAGVFIEPVALNGCGHVFCASCVQRWINSLPPYPEALLPGDPVPAPVSCPHCRHTPIQNASPSRLAKTLVTLLLERHPELARPANEHKQAEEVYRPPMGVLTFPVPPRAPRQVQSHEFWRPCDSCYPEGDVWKCPAPVPRFDVPTERDRCLLANSVCPDGHRLCAGCERLSPANGPNSSNCGICGEGFCGNARSGVCECNPLPESKPTSQFNGLPYVLEDCPSDLLAMAFKDNWIEMCRLGVYLGKQEETLTAQAIYNSILEWVRSPEGTESGGLLGLMTRADINLRLRIGMAQAMQSAITPVAEGETPSRICGGCADEVFCAGILEWWMRELKKPEVASDAADTLRDRPDCKFGRKCTRQEIERHAKKFNHICDPLPADQAAQIQQDDNMPGAATAVSASVAAGGDPPSEGSAATASAVVPVLGEESDSDDSDDDDDDGRNYVDVGTQYDAEPEGTVLVVHNELALHPCWTGGVPVGGTRVVATQIAPAPAPAFAIANLINSSVSPPPAGSSRATARGSSPVPSRMSSPVPRVSASASSPLMAAYSWPMCGTPPPLQPSYASLNNNNNHNSNQAGGSGAGSSKVTLPPPSALMMSGGTKLPMPLPHPHSHVAIAGPAEYIGGSGGLGVGPSSSWPTMTAGGSGVGGGRTDNGGAM